MENPHLMGLQLSAHPEPTNMETINTVQPPLRYPRDPTGAQRDQEATFPRFLGYSSSRTGMAMCTNPQQLPAGSSPYLCVLPDGEFLTLGLLECIDRNPELTVSHTRRWALVKFLWGARRQRQRRSAFCRPLLSVPAACLPFFSLLLAAFALGTSLLQLQHSLDACLLLPRGSLASPGHTANHPTRREQKTNEELTSQADVSGVKQCMVILPPFPGRHKRAFRQMCILDQRQPWLAIQFTGSKAIFPLSTANHPGVNKTGKHLISEHFDSASVLNLRHLTASQ